MHTILHIEPNLHLQKQLLEVLESEHINLIQVNNVTLAIDYMLGDMPNLVICGEMLQDQTVLHLKARFKMLRWDVPVMLLTETPCNTNNKVLERIGINYVHQHSDSRMSIYSSINDALGVPLLPQAKLLN